MELTDGEGPIIMDDCCLNCVHSIVKNNGVVCGDRPWALRMLMGLRPIQYPYTEKCNRFEAIPNPIYPQCKYCEFFDRYHEATACYNMGLAKLLWQGPQIVMPTETCRNFSLHEKYKQRTR